MKLIDVIEIKQQNQITAFFKNVIYDAPAQVHCELTNIRNVAEKSNMMACPIEYFDIDSAIKPEMFDLFENKTEVVNSILNFVRYFSENAQVYVLCPIQFYDVEKHIKSNIDKDIFCPKYEQALFTINALMPNLRATERRLTNLENIQKQMAESVKRLVAIDDPMLFAIPKNKTIYDNAQAIIGTCWGKDISSKVIKDLNLINYKHNMRKKIIGTYKKLNVSAIELKYQNDLKTINAEIDQLHKSIENATRFHLARASYLYRPTEFSRSKLKEWENNQDLELEKWYASEQYKNMLNLYKSACETQAHIIATYKSISKDY